MRKSQAPSFRPNIRLGTTVSNAPSGNCTENIVNLLKGACKQSQDNQKDPTAAVIFKSPNVEIIDGKEKIYSIVYGKQTKKKHKTWEGDGTLHVGIKFLTAKDEEGKSLGTVPVSKCKEIVEGSRFYLGSKEIEVIGEMCNDASPKRKAEPMNMSIPKKPRMFESRLAIKTDDEFYLPEPSAEHQWSFSDGRSVIPVAVEPFLARKLRPHQRKGVSFLYECIMGFKDTSISGAILADEMGLGKTLQCIALIWTLLKQGPYGKSEIRRVLIVTPSSLTGNWSAEFKKWLGMERLTPYVIDARHKPEDQHPNDRVFIISYEMLLRHHSAVGDNFDLLICDEAHRLKNSDTKVSQALNDLCASRRILLTGTPMQNDLQEFFALVDFANPNCVGNNPHFRRQYEEPILAARQPEASDDTRELGEERVLELNQITSVFILRRTQSVLDGFLPGKMEIIVFCKASPLQRTVYNAILDSLGNLSSGLEGAFHLGVIAALRKAASHPGLLQAEEQCTGSSDKINSQVTNIANSAMLDEDITLAQHSGKLMVVSNFLSTLWACSPRERVVLVSAFTQTLDMLEQLCQSFEYPILRLDGSTPSNQRNDIVSRFNQDSSQFVFLLSAKAGGVGLNLIGASRLILFDSDWNPATDLQAMARIWRDGQRRQVYIYRLLTTGTIEEKMFQRQLSKQTLAGGIIDSISSNSVLLSRDELKNIFEPCEDVDECWTHKSLGCDCNGSGSVPEPPEKENRSCQLQINTNRGNTLKMEELMSWEHYAPPINNEILKDRKLVGSEEFITYMFSTHC